MKLFASYCQTLHIGEILSIRTLKFMRAGMRQLCHENYGMKFKKSETEEEFRLKLLTHMELQTANDL